MPLNRKKTGDSENLFAGLILFVALIIAYMIYTSSSSPSIDLSLEPSPREQFDPKIKNLDLDFSVFDRIIFKQLKIFGLIPVRPEKAGREDPFASF